MNKNNNQNDDKYPEDEAMELVEPVLALIVYLLLIVGSLDFNLVQQFTVKKAQTITGIVGGIYFSGLLVGIAVIGGIFVYVIVSVKIVKSVSQKALCINIIIVCSLFVVLMAYALIIDGHYFSDFEAVREDLRAVKSEKFEQKTVFLVENKSSDAYLKLRFYHDDLGVFDYYKCPMDSDMKVLFVPKYLNFELDQEHPYGDYQFIELNKAYAQQYQVTYTPNLKIVVKIEKIGQYIPEAIVQDLNKLQYVSGYNSSVISEEDHTWMENCSHLEFSNGRIMDFSWKCPERLLTQYVETETILTFKTNNMSGDSMMQACVLNDFSEEIYELAQSFTKEQWIEYLQISYNNGMCKITDEDDVIKAIFEIEAEDKSAKGFELCLLDKNYKAFYGFIYSEPAEYYNEQRARNVIDSINACCKKEAGVNR